MASHLTLVPKGALINLPHASQEERFPGKNSESRGRAVGHNDLGEDTSDKVLEVLQHTVPLSEQQVRAHELLKLIDATKRGAA